MTLLLDQITRDVSESFGIEYSLLRGKRRTKPIAQARHALFWLVRHRLGLSYPQIARALKRDHTGIMYGVNRVDSKWMSSPGFCEKISPVIKKYALPFEQDYLQSIKKPKRVSVDSEPIKRPKPKRKRKQKEKAIPYFRNPNPFKPKLVKAAGGWNVRVF